MPQLLRLQERLLENQLGAEEAEAQLVRLDEALGEMIGQFDEFGRQILSLPLDDAQSGTVAGFLSPARESLVGLRAVAAELSLDGHWSQAQWSKLKLRQQTLLQASQGIQFLRQQLLQFERKAQP
ncbi:hypothetical protein JST97_34665 [bacterium]|nr:hypothetical protein [bacterium]